MPQYFELRNLDSQEIIRLEEAAVVLGRGERADIVIHSEEASRAHARLSLDGDCLVVEDLQSTNGTYVNNRKISGRTELSGGDIIGIGDQKYRVIAPNSSGDTTIFGARVADDGSYVLEKSDPDATSIRHGFAMPPGWSSDERDRFSGNRSREEILMDQRLAAQQVDAGQHVAALLTLSGKGDKPLYLLPRETSGGRWGVGRSRACDVTLGDYTVSGHHATLMYANGEWSVEDRDSTNGMKVNGTRSQYAVIHSGDHLTFGEVELLFRVL